MGSQIPLQKAQVNSSGARRFSKKWSHLFPKRWAANDEPPRPGEERYEAKPRATTQEIALCPYRASALGLQPNRRDRSEVVMHNRFDFVVPSDEGSFHCGVRLDGQAVK